MRVVLPVAFAIALFCHLGCDQRTEIKLVTVPSGTFTMGDGSGPCGYDKREVTLTRGFYLGQHEVTNQEYLDAVQWAYDSGYVTATTSSVSDAMDGSTVELLDLGVHVP